MKNRSNLMLLFSASILGLVALLVVANIFSVSILGYHYQSATDLDDYSNNINLSTSVLAAHRGTIYDKDMNILAEDTVSYTLYAIVDPSRPAIDGHQAYVSDFEDTATKLAEVLKVDQAYLLERLQQAEYQTEFGAYGRHLTAETKAAIEALKLPGLGFNETLKRTYPLDTFASYLLGFANDDDQTVEIDLIGRMGLEASLNARIKGTDGFQVSTVDSQGYVLPGSKQTIQAAVNGNSVILTLDRTLQDQLELTMAETERVYGATQTWGTIVEVKTGKILAFAQNKNFDLNNVDTDNFMTFGSQMTYEPGSTMKTFVYAAAIEEGVYNGKATFDSGPFIYGYVNWKLSRLKSMTNAIGVIRNVARKNFGVIDYDSGYAMSSNVGIASLLTESLDPEIFKKYLADFNFFKPVDTDLQPETTAEFSLNTTSDLLHIGFGQGISVNMLQMVQAYTAILNGGTMMKPYVVDRIINSDTKEVLQQNEPTIVGQPISEGSSQQVIDLMRYTVTHPQGTCRKFELEKTQIICKSGTAQLVDNGSYSENEFIYSYVIGLPYDDPQILLYYAFRSPTMTNTDDRNDQIKEILKTIEFYTFDRNPVNEEVLTSFELPSFINHTSDFASMVLSTKTNPTVVIGNGSTIINQYPSAHSTILSTQRILLLSSYDSILMPDMTGWSKKDVLAFFRLANRSVSIDGEGFVSSQSIPAGLEMNDAEVTFIVCSR
jgi:penicillin-binding protein 2B